MISTGFGFISVKNITGIMENSSKTYQFFTPSELDYCNKYKENYVSLAGILAAKLAFLKASPFLKKPSIKEIEVRHDESGKPFISINNQKIKNYSISVSISHTKSVAVAFCVVSKNGKIFSSIKKKRYT